MSDPGPERALSAEEQEAVRVRVRRAMETEGVTQAALSRGSGLAYSTLSAWLGGKYTGDNARVAEQMQRWLHARTVRERTRSKMPTAPGYLETPSAEVFGEMLAHAQHMPDMVVVTGAPGVGKTTACEAYQASSSNVWLLTGEPAFGTPHVLLDALAEVLAVAERSSTRLSRAIVRRLVGSGGLLIIDEAQHLSTKALDQLRTTVHDNAKIGVALMGNETVYSRLEGLGRTVSHAQLYSRVGMRLARPRALAADIAMLLDGWRIEDEEQRKLLTAIGRKPGALRNITKCLRVAHMLAAGDGAALAKRHILLAWQRLSSDGREPEGATP